MLKGTTFKIVPVLRVCWFVFALLARWVATPFTKVGKQRQLTGKRAEKRRRVGIVWTARHSIVLEPFHRCVQLARGVTYFLQWDQRGRCIFLQSCRDAGLGLAIGTQALQLVKWTARRRGTVNSPRGSCGRGWNWAECVLLPSSLISLDPLVPYLLFPIK